MHAQRVQQIAAVDEALYAIAEGPQRERRGPDDDRWSRRHRQGSNHFLHRTRGIQLTVLRVEGVEGLPGNLRSSRHTKVGNPVASGQGQPSATPMPVVPAGSGTDDLATGTSAGSLLDLS